MILADKVLWNVNYPHDHYCQYISLNLAVYLSARRKLSFVPNRTPTPKYLLYGFVRLNFSISFGKVAVSFWHTLFVRLRFQSVTVKGGLREHGTNQHRSHHGLILKYLETQVQEYVMREKRRLPYVMCKLWLSEGRPSLDARVMSKSQSGVILPLTITIFAMTAISEDKLDIGSPRRFSLAFCFL